MQTPSSHRADFPAAVGMAAAVTAAGTPVLLRSLMRWSVVGPISSTHVHLAQFTLLALAGLGAHRVARAAGRPLPPWRAWAADAASLCGALALIVAGRIVSGGGGIPLRPEAISLVFTAPVVEEIVYRGLLPGFLAPRGAAAHRDLSRLRGAMVASAAFAAAHAIGNGYSWAGAFSTFALSFGCGLAFHLLREVSGGLAAPMAAHAGVNAMTLHAMG